MRRSELVLTPLLVALLLLSPWIGRLVGIDPFRVEPTEPEALPTLGVDELADAGTFTQIDEYLDDRMALRGQVAAETSNVFIAATGDVPVSNALRGRDGSLFLTEGLTNPCRIWFDADKLADRLDRWSTLGKGREILLVVAPDKSSIQVDDLPARARRDCQAEREQEMLAAFGDDRALIPLWDPLRNSVDPSQQYRLYYKYDSHWTFRGAQIMVREVIDRVAPGQFDRAKVIRASNRKRTRGAIARRLGWDEVESRNRLTCERDGTNTVRRKEPSGSRDVTVFRSVSAADEPLIAGRTLVVHDSMMPAGQQPLACHFAHTTFVEWDHFDSSAGIELMTKADRIIFESVERSIHIRSVNRLLDPAFDAVVTAELSN